MSDLLKLAERCEQAKGPDRLLDANIHWNVKPESFEADNGYRETWYCYARGGWTLNKADRIYLNTVGVPLYTASLDAALKLVPCGYDWIIGRTNDGLTIHAEVGGRGDEFMRFGATPALALCAAALRAIAGEARSGETVQQGSTGTASTRADRHRTNPVGHLLHKRSD